MSVEGKKLLVLGGTAAGYDLVKNAKEMGVYTIVVDDREGGVAKRIADEEHLISTTDIDALVAFAKEKNVDGVFSGPAEFNIKNVMKVCERTGHRCYADMDVWNICGNKDVFKSYCRKYNVDCTPEYEITDETTDEELAKIDYPIIIKPVDRASSTGITVCREASEVRAAYKIAMDASYCKRIIAEKYIENGGEIFTVRYMVRNGEAYPYFLMDTYIADPINKKSLISAFTYAPSKYLEYYMENMDANVRKMLKGMGIKNGTAFIQSLPCDGKIYFHEMGFRLSGGMIFKLTEPAANINDMKMMIKYALGEEIFTDEEIAKVDITCKNKKAAQLMVPLNKGTIGEIIGLDEIKKIDCISDFIQYYEVGREIEDRFIGTLAQHFGRISLIASTTEEIYEAVEKIQKTLVIKDTNGNIMNELKFDLGRI